MPFHRQKQTRREFLAVSAAGLAAFAASGAAAKTDDTKMFKNLACGHIGVDANLHEAIDYAARLGFGGTSPNVYELEKMSPQQRKETVALLKEKGLRWGASGLPVEFRKSEEQYKDNMGQLPDRAKVLNEVGVTRVSTWILPGSNDLTYLEHFEQHRRRLKNVAETLNDHGMRLGLEFVGPRTARRRFRFPFISTQAEMLELCDAIDTGNVGLLLDAWHWHTSHGTGEEINQLTNDLVVHVHVNDAPKGVPIDELQDLKRKLPCTTGVIDLKTFMNTLQRIGYDGPVECEPFDNELRQMENEPALRKTIDALDRLFELIEA